MNAYFEKWSTDEGAKGIRLVYQDSPDVLEVQTVPDPEIRFIISSSPENPDHVDLYEGRVRDRLVNHFLLLCAMLALEQDSEDSA